MRLVDAYPLSRSVRGLVFEHARGALAYRAGQTIELIVPTARGLAMRRPYSIASGPGALGDARFELAVSRVENGPTSTALHALDVGAELVAEGPHGGWLGLGPRERALRTLLVATGSGLAPFRAIVHERLRTKEPAALGVLFGCRTPDDILWWEEMQCWSRSLPNLRLDVTLSQPPAAWNGRRGYVQAHLRELVADLAPDLVLICGLSPMVDEVERALAALGVPPVSIRSESYDR